METTALPEASEPLKTTEAHAPPETIALNAKYTFDVSKMNQIKVGDTFKSVNELRKTVIQNYNETNPSGATKTLIDDAVSHFLTYEKTTPNGYKIIITHKNQLHNVDFTPLQQTQRPYLTFKKHVEILFAHFFSAQEDVFFLTTSQLIKEFKIFHSFYGDYVKTHYDSKYSTRTEISKLEKVLSRYGFLSEKDYITDRMEELQRFVYSVFSKKNIETIAKKNDITAVKLWQQGEETVDENFRIYWENTYVMPLYLNGTPPQYITRIANKQYMRDYKTCEQTHEYIYSIWKFEKNSIVFNTPVSTTQIDNTRKQLNHNFMAKLQRSSVDCAGGNHHASKKAVLNDLINSLTI